MSPNAGVQLQAHLTMRAQWAIKECLGSCTTLVDTRELGGTVFECNR
jgi:hypothetical protein